MEQTRAAPPAASSAAWRRSSWLLPGGLVVLLAFLTANVLANGPVVTMDRRIRALVHPEATSAAWRWLASGGLAPAQLITDLGYTKIGLPVLAVSAVAVALRHRSLRPLFMAAAGGALLAVTVIPGKILIARPGPGFSTLAPGAWGDFPSGHASTAGVCYGLAVLLLTAEGSLAVRRVAEAATAAVCFLVGVALVWCDYHWVSDVVAGWALAALIVWIVWRSRRWWPGGWEFRQRGTVAPETEQRSITDDRARA